MLVFGSTFAGVLVFMGVFNAILFWIARGCYLCIKKDKVVGMIRDQSGNVLFYILIAVALLAALSYTVAQTNRGGAQSIGKERAGIVSSEIIEYAQIVGNAVSQLRLRGVKDTQISFENEKVTGYENANCVEDGCKIYNLNGGGISYSAPKEEWLDSKYSEEPRYGELYFNASAMGLAKGSDTKDDLIMFVPYLKKSICIAINKALGVHLNSDDTPSEKNGPFETSAKFNGFYNDVSDFYVAGDNTSGQDELFSSYSAGCTKSSGMGAAPAAGSYHFFKVLIAR